MNTDKRDAVAIETMIYNKSHGSAQKLHYQKKHCKKPQRHSNTVAAKLSICICIACDQETGISCVATPS